jgi:ornithine racemase
MATLFIYQEKIHHNIKQIKRLFARHGNVSIYPVVKVFAGDRRILRWIEESGLEYIADSRIENLKKFANSPLKKVHLRLGQITEAKRIIQYSDISLQSQLPTINELQRQAILQNKVHSILLMFDVGDLREGIFYQEDFLPLVSKVEALSHIHLLGIGTNLTCYGGVVPSVFNMNELIKIANKIEAHIQRPLEVISGGNSSIFPLLEERLLPRRINNVRIGEAIFFGRETAYGETIPGCEPTTCILEAELIECEQKPSMPIGEMTMDSFGSTPSIIDKGRMNRGIIAIGKQDVNPHYLLPLHPKVSILGGSSDHLIVDLGESGLVVGDTCRFTLTYPGLLQVCTSPYVKKRFISERKRRNP